MPKPKDKLALVLHTFVQRGKRERAAWEAARLALTNKRQERQRLTELQEEYAGQLGSADHNSAQSRQGRIELLSTILSLVKAMDKELGRLELAETRSQAAYRSCLARQRAVERLQTKRLQQRQQRERRQDRANP